VAWRKAVSQQRRGELERARSVASARWHAAHRCAPDRAARRHYRPSLHRNCDCLARVAWRFSQSTEQGTRGDGRSSAGFAVYRGDAGPRRSGRALPPLGL